MTRAILALLLALGLTSVVAPPSVSETAAPPASSRAVAAKPAPPLRLHATTGPRAAIRDETGAQVLLRGINVMSLAEYYQPNPAYPTVVPLTEADFRDIAKVGFNTVRLLVTWSSLEPTRGAYDKAYVAKVRQAVGWARKYGLYVVIDMHQDAWGPGVFTPADVTCPSGTHANNGWDGAPVWATITDGQTTCLSGERETAPAVTRAWQNFYDDKDGIQTHLVNTWGRLAQDFARYSNVAGFDLLNEPGFGTAADNDADLGRFYGRAIRAIRAGEKRGKGFSHIVFFEPSVMWSAFGSWTTPAPGFTKDRNIVFAPHIYAESLAHDITIRGGFEAARDTAAEYGTTVWSGEWGFFPNEPKDSAREVERYGAAEDAFKYGGAWWAWKQACGNPHTVPSPGAEPNTVSHGLIRYTCRPTVAFSGPDPAFAEVLGRPYPRRVPGRITKLTSNGRTGAFLLEGVHLKGATRCGLRVFVPAAYTGKSVRVSGVTKIKRINRVGGNVVLSGCVADKFRVRIG